MAGAWDIGADTIEAGDSTCSSPAMVSAKAWALSTTGSMAALSMSAKAHARIRAEVGAGPDQGKRYSWGYPSCPDLTQHALVDQLIDAGAAGISITEGFQFDPEQTTAALVVLHPGARYFALALSGGE